MKSGPRKKILIIGGTGFIGFHLAKKCLKNNWEVTSISTQYPKLRKINSVKYIKLDISKKRDFRILKKKTFDGVVNAGGYVDHHNKKKTYNSHFLGLKNLVYYFKKKKINKFIQIGSSAEYGKLRSPQFEDDYCNPKMIYGKSKHLSTKFLLKCFKEFSFPCVILRLYQVYGPYQDNNRLIPIVINKSITNQRFPCSTGNQYRDFLYISDCVNAIYKAINSTKVTGEIINIGQGKPAKVQNIINKVNKKIGFGKPLFGLIKLRKDEGKIIYPSIIKAKTLLKWKPKINLSKGLNKTIMYYQNFSDKY